MAYIITNISTNLPPKHPMNGKDIKTTIKDKFGVTHNLTIKVDKPLILDGDIIPKEFHFLQVKGFITMTPITSQQYEFLKSQEEKDKKPQVQILDKEIISPNKPPKETSKITSKVVSKKS